MLAIHFSNRFEALEDELTAALDEPPESPFDFQTVIVPSAAVRERLTRTLADRHGVCAGVDFAFLAQWLWRGIVAAVPGVPAQSPFAASVLQWRIFESFGDAAFSAQHPRLAAWLERADAAMRLDLAQRVAELFEQYVTYRPDWLQAWSAGGSEAFTGDDALAADERWQAHLWRRVEAQLGLQRRHPALSFIEAIESAERPVALPRSVHVFALPAIAPLYAELLQRLGRHIDVRLYVLNPCREYWFDVVDRRRLGWLASRGRAAHHEEGHRLLAAWGKQKQAHIDLLYEHAGETAIDDARFVANAESAAAPSLLARLQDSILDLADLAPASHAMAAGDRSLEVHVCHSLTRELEVLHDQLLDAFAQPDPPRPADIAVVVPDLDAAAALIDAVFGTAPAERRIAYTISGRPRSKANPLARALLDALALAASRCSASDAYALLQQSVVARRFDLDDDALASIRKWMQDAGVRWGLDAAHRADFDLPPTPRNTFDDGLDRLFLGYALPQEASEPFDGRCAAGNAEGSDAIALGAFAAFVDRLHRLRDDLKHPRTGQAWIELLAQTLDAFAAAQREELDDLSEVRGVLAELSDALERSEVKADLPAAAVVSALQQALDDPQRGGVPSGSVTFAAIGGLRLLPYRIVCALGLGDGAFPVPARPLEFDLIAAKPRRGDRQRRNDDRNVFLDLLLAARERFYLSYTGRSVRDNAALPPSVLVSELIEYVAPVIADAADAGALARARSRIVVEHPLQPFSPDAFSAAGDARRRSFDSEYGNALQARRAVTKAPAESRDPTTAEVESAEDIDAEAERRAAALPPFFERALDPPGDEWREVSLAQLREFFVNPCRYLLKRRLRIDLLRDEGELEDDEPFVAGYREREALAKRLLPRLLEHEVDAAAAGEAVDSELIDVARAGIEYPQGGIGDALLAHELRRLGAFVARLRGDLAPPCLPPHPASLEFEIEGESWRLAGAFSDLRCTGLVRHRYSDVYAGDYLAAWLEHLLLCATAPERAQPRMVWHSCNGSFALRPLEPARAKAALKPLLASYRQGLREPLRFFPKSSWALVTVNLREARAKWFGHVNRPFGESRDAAYRLALREVPDPLDDAFERCARAVYGPLVEHLDDPRVTLKRARR